MRTATSLGGTVAVLSVLAIGSPTSAQPVCVGDCNGDGMVAINELIIGVNIALGSAPLSMCPSFDANGDGMVGINELITAVNNALNGCGPPAGCDVGGTTRVYNVAPGVLLAPATGPDSTTTGLFTTGTGGANAAMSFSPGPFRIVMGTADADGVACLALAEDVTFSVDIVDSTCLCLKFFAEGSDGSIDCNGGTPYGTEARRTAGMPGFGWTVTTGQGADAGPGGANLLVMGNFERVMETCAQADCPTFVYADPPNLFAFTTATATAVQETSAAPIEFMADGANFDCAMFGTSNSGGMIAAPAPTTIDPIGDVANVFRFGEMAP